MPKVICVVSGSQVIPGPKILVSYSASIDVPPISFSADFEVNTTLNATVNLVNMRTKLVSDCASQGVTLLTSDVIVFGGPT